MMHTLMMILTIPCLLLANIEKTCPPVRKPLEQYLPAVKSNNDFGLSLYRLLSDEKDNVIFSPFSIHSCLSMVYLGANGETAIELQKGLCYPFDQDEAIAHISRLQTILNGLNSANVSFNIANALWVEKDYPLLSSYETLLKDHFDSCLQEAEFSQNPLREKERINQWVADKTQNEIKNILQDDDISVDTRIVLANALFLKGAWRTPFCNMGEQPFLLEEGQAVSAPSMSLTEDFLYSENSLHKSAFIPLNHPSLGCLVLLPQEGVSLDQLENSLSHEDVTEIFQENSFKKLHVTLPKFSITYKVRLKETLKKLGMELPFSFLSDFSKMTENDDLSLDQVIHQAKIDFDEKGITAAAATVAIMNCKSSYTPHVLPPIPFHADRPFLFAIMDKETKTILFWGRVKNPISFTL